MKTMAAAGSIGTSLTSLYYQTQTPQRVPFPIYGDGSNVRDWLYVKADWLYAEDHADALLIVVQKGVIGRSYNIGGENDRSNLQLVQTLCAILDEERLLPYRSYADQITFITDRPGHHARYAIDPTRIRDELGWRPSQLKTGCVKR